jgi:hypothetical protein
MSLGMVLLLNYMVNNDRSIFYETFGVLVANRRIDLPHLLAKATLVIRAFPERLWGGGSTLLNQIPLTLFGASHMQIIQKPQVRHDVLPKWSG